MEKYLLLAAFLLLSTLSFSKETKQVDLTLATTYWCPYTCVNEGKDSNIIGNYVTRILAKHNINLKIVVLPWSRAIKSAEQGHVDGLLTATHSEAPNLNFTKRPISHFQVCFYSNKTINWRYSEPLDLQELILGVIQDYGYDEAIDHYISDTSNSEQLVSLTGNEGTPRLLQMLLKRRVDIIVEDRLVVKWHATKNNINLPNIVNVGCSKAQPFYLALNNYKKNNQAVINILNQEFSQPENKLILQEIISKHSL